MNDRNTMPLSIDDIDSQTLGTLLQQSPSATGNHGWAAVQVIARMADGTLLDAKYVRRALTIDQGQVFIDWQMVAQVGCGLLADRQYIGPSSPSHPDAGMALVLAAALATRQITDSGIGAMRLALNAAAK